MSKVISCEPEYLRDVDGCLAPLFEGIGFDGSVGSFCDDLNTRTFGETKFCEENECFVECASVSSDHIECSIYEICELRVRDDEYEKQEVTRAGKVATFLCVPVMALTV